MTPRSESGSVTVVTVTLTVALLAIAGLVFDGGRIITAQQQADAVAEAAARSATQELDDVALHNADIVTIDTARGERRALGSLTAAGYTGTVTVTGDRATVTVARERTTSLLALVGISSVTVHGDGSARAVRGITIEGG